MLRPEVFTYDSCIFCGRKPSTTEDILPKWLQRTLPRGAWTHDRSLHLGPLSDTASSRVLAKQAKANVANLSFKGVCAECNGGWMKALQDNVIDLLNPMRKGRNVELDPAGQARVASWAAMTSVTTVAKEGFLVGPSVRKHLMSYRTPPPGSYVGLSRAASAPNNMHFGTRPHGLAPKGKGNPGLVCGLIFDQAVLVTAMPTTRRPRNWPIRPIDHVAIWPSEDEVKHWPPGSALTSAGIDLMVDAFVRVALGA